MKPTNADIKIKPYKSRYATEICTLFHASIHAIDIDIYTKKQQEAWCSGPPDQDKWRERLEESQPWMAMLGDAVVGFIELEESGYIDCMYVHPDFQGFGIAKKLYEHITTLAKERSLLELSVDASKVARPIFEKWGFTVEQCNKIEREDQVLVNFYMTKKLGNLRSG